MILNIYKPSTWTSFDVVKKIKIITKEKKVGHGGTLDHFAEGVLKIGTNIDTKKIVNKDFANCILSPIYFKKPDQAGSLT